MPRFIDAHLLLDNLKKQYGEELGWQYTVNMSDVGMMIEDAPSADVVPKSEVERLEKEIKALLAFKDYFSDLYGHGLEIANWHENGELEYFDMFYESAVDEYEAELKKKYTEVK
jgi:hypothetical protein